MTSFDFTWDKQKKAPAAKVVKKRVAPNKINKKETPQKGPAKSVKDKTTPVKKSHITKEPVTQKQPQQTETQTRLLNLANNTLVNSNNNNKTKEFVPRDKFKGKDDSPQKFVKRKQNKDKAAAKKLIESGEEPEQTSNPKPNKITQHSLFSEHKDMYVKTNIKGVSVVEKVFSADKKFSSLDIHKHLLSNLEKHNFITLTNVQEKSIPLVLNGKNLLVSQFITFFFNINQK